MMNLAQLDLGLALLAAHGVADFLCQPDWMVKAKGRRPVLLLHGLIVAGLAYGFAGRWTLWLLPAWVFVSHVLIDALKVRSGKNTLPVFLLDQAAHLAVIGGLVWWLGASGELSWWSVTCGPQVWRIWVLVTGAIVCVRVGSIIVGFWAKPYLDEVEQARSEASVGVKAARGLTNGGRVIGQLERLLIFVFVGLGQPGAIGFLIAAKSIFRFGELKDRENRMEAEYITIGTLMSFGWAIIVSYVTWKLALRF